jgi:hypothetical protein
LTVYGDNVAPGINLKPQHRYRLAVDRNPTLLNQCFAGPAGGDTGMG